MCDWLTCLLTHFFWLIFFFDFWNRMEYGDVFWSVWKVSFCFLLSVFFFSLFCFLVLSWLLGNVASSPLFFCLIICVKVFLFFCCYFHFLHWLFLSFWVLRNVVLSFFYFWSHFRCDFFLFFSSLIISIPRKCCLQFDVFVIFFPFHVVVLSLVRKCVLLFIHFILISVP